MEKRCGAASASFRSGASHEAEALQNFGESSLLFEHFQG